MFRRTGHEENGDFGRLTHVVEEGMIPASAARQRYPSRNRSGVCAAAVATLASTPYQRIYMSRAEVKLLLVLASIRTDHHPLTQFPSGPPAPYTYPYPSPHLPALI